MLKKEFVAAIAEKAGCTQVEVNKVIDAMADVIIDTLKADDKVALANLGSFEVKARAERQGVNPSTGAKIVIPACKAPTFKVGKALKDAVK